ncbi:PREDICTED: programmed cell death protein 1 [Crocodylus porosus]|uniref:programmed cell death protein 1 n=1 Tax=Crocodylus porosus TaxID=8502 RepID=UPI00093ABEBA|nr:PREDICTED: programmed cell death protein 1 [Crocodylus porosus]
MAGRISLLSRDGHVSFPFLPLLHTVGGKQLPRWRRGRRDAKPPLQRGTKAPHGDTGAPATPPGPSRLDCARCSPRVDPVAARGLSETAMERLPVIVAGVCMLLLCCTPGLLLSQLVTFHPPTLVRQEGDTASFFCNISRRKFQAVDDNLNWYKATNGTQSLKIAGLQGNKKEIKTAKYHLINHTSAIEMKLLNLQKNDTGLYFCGLITFSPSHKVIESNRSMLTVTEAVMDGNTTDTPDEILSEPYPRDLYKVLLIVGLIVTTLALLLLFSYLLFLITHRRGKEPKPQSGNALKGDKTVVVTEPTVDYGVLEFQRDEKPPAPGETASHDQTEYATIVFPEEKPITPERGKRNQHQRNCQTHLQPC